MSDTPARKGSRRNWVLIAAMAVLAFSALGYLGNFVQWIGAPRTSARVLNAERQWLRRGVGNLNVDIEYEVQGARLQGKVHVSSSTMEAACVNDRMDVYYMKDTPERVIPVALLHKKQNIIYVTTIVGFILLAVGLALRRKGDT